MKPDLDGLYSALDSAATIIALSDNDWRSDTDLAWLYGLFAGWDDAGADATMAEVATRHSWPAADVDRLRRLRSAVAGFDFEAVGRLQELPRLFDLQWKRSTEATARWRAADPATRGNVMPDLGDLLKWLMDDADQARTTTEGATQQILLDYTRWLKDMGQLTPAPEGVADDDDDMVAHFLHERREQQQHPEGVL